MESRKRKHLLIGAIMIATIAMGCVLFFSGDPEPAYAGKSLSAWVDAPVGAMPPLKHSSEAVSAIRAIGTNALPFLVEWIRYEPSDLRVKSEPRVRSLPSWLLNPLTWRLLYRDIYRAQAAKEAFIALGPAAAPAVPQLHAIFLATSNNSVRANVVLSLVEIGPEAAPALANIAATTAYGVMIVHHMDRDLYRANLDAFTPILLSYLRGPDVNMASFAATGFARLQPDPEHSVPALIAALERPEDQIRIATCIALGNYGAEATAALPVLARLASETAPGTQVNLTSRIAIEKITGVVSQ